MIPSPATDYYLSALMADRLREAEARRRHRGFDFTPWPRRRPVLDRLRRLLSRAGTGSASGAVQVPNPADGLGH